MPCCIGCEKNPFLPPRSIPFVGIDDFAFKKRTRYGTLFVDLLNGSVIDLIPTRNKEEVTEWLRSHPEIQLITRDGSKTYRNAVLDASPKICQVSDRWHIFHRLFEAVKKEVVELVPREWVVNQGPESECREALDDQPMSVRAEQREKNANNKWMKIKEVQRLTDEGMSERKIAKQLDLSRKTVSSYKKIRKKPSGRRSSRFDAFRPLIRKLLGEGKSTNMLETVLRAEGFSGSRSTLNFMVAEERRNSRIPVRLFIQQKILRTLWMNKEGDLVVSLKDLHPKIPEEFPSLIELGAFIKSFRLLFKEKRREGLRKWLIGQKNITALHLVTFINGLRQDIKAVYHAVTLKFSNGPVEGIINKLKNVKRMMYGRANTDLLFRRLILK